MLQWIISGFIAYIAIALLTHYALYKIGIIEDWALCCDAEDIVLLGLLWFVTIPFLLIGGFVTIYRRMCKKIEHKVDERKEDKE